MFFAPVRENLTLFSPFIYLTYCYLYAILVHLSDRTVFSAHVITAVHEFYSPTKNHHMPVIYSYPLLRSTHYHSSRFLSTSSSTKIRFTSTLAHPLQSTHLLSTYFENNSHPFSPPRSSLYRQLPVPFARILPDNWATIPQF